MLKEALNIKYWNNYYKNKNLASQSTKFAVFCKKKLKHYKGILYDIGCGNGRDSIYFNKKRAATVSEVFVPLPLQNFKNSSIFCLVKFVERALKMC